MKTSTFLAIYIPILIAITTVLVIAVRQQGLQASPLMKKIGLAMVAVGLLVLILFAVLRFS